MQAKKTNVFEWQWTMFTCQLVSHQLRHVKQDSAHRRFERTHLSRQFFKLKSLILQTLCNEFEHVAIMSLIE